MRKTVQEIYIKCPKKMQVMMFSATMSDDMRIVARKLMKNVRTSPARRLRPSVEVASCRSGQHSVHREGAVTAAVCS